MVCCERHCGGCLGVGAECQLHYTSCKVDITSRPAYSVTDAVRTLPSRLRERDPIKPRGDGRLLGSHAPAFVRESREGLRWGRLG